MGGYPSQTTTSVPRIISTSEQYRRGWPAAHLTRRGGVCEAEWTRLLCRVELSEWHLIGCGGAAVPLFDLAIFLLRVEAVAELATNVLLVVTYLRDVAFQLKILGLMLHPIATIPAENDLPVE